MTKKELIGETYRRLGGKVPRSHVTSVINTMLTTTSEALIRGEKVSIANFGTFKSYTREPRSAVNPRTKERVVAPKRRIVAFKPLKILKENIN